MNHRAEINRLKEIRTICGAQRMRVELDVARLNAELDALERRRDSGNRHLTALEDSWKKAVTGASLQLTAAAFCSAEILRTRTVVANIEEAIRRARTARQTLFDTLTSMSARDDAVGALKDRAVRLAMRQGEEAALENHALRATAEWRNLCE